MSATEPTICVGLVFSLSGGDDSLVLWWKGDSRSWVEVRGHLDVDENDPLQKVIDALPSWFVSGLMADDYVTVTPWDRYEAPYRVLQAILKAE